MKLSGITRVVPVLIALLLAGCDTDEELLKQRIGVLRAEAVALQLLHAQLSDSAALEGPGAVSVFLSKDVLDAVLAAADGLVVAVPGVDGASIRLTSMRTDFRLGLPGIRVQAVATKKGLDGQLELIGVARLEPTIERSNPSHLALRIHVDSIVPRAKWGVLDFGIGGFVRDLMQVKLTEQLRTAGVIRVPIETDLALALAPKQVAFTVQGVTGNIATPALSLTAKGSVNRIISLPDGLHVYGTIAPVKEAI